MSHEQMVVQTLDTFFHYRLRHDAKLVRLLADAIRQAVAQEREACAQIADCGRGGEALAIALSIRGRGEERPAGSDLS